VADVARTFSAAVLGEGGIPYAQTLLRWGIAGEAHWCMLTGQSPGAF
jgi:hypothetical protein